MAWLLKELGYKGWVSGYYHEGNKWEESDDEDALAYTDYECECIGNRSGFVNENAKWRAAAPTLIEAYQFLIEHGYEIDILVNHNDKEHLVQVSYSTEHGLDYIIEAPTLDEALDRVFDYIV